MKRNDRKRIFLPPPHMCGEEMRLVKAAFESNYIAPLGPMVDAFEKEFAEKVGIKHAVPFQAERQPCIWHSVFSASDREMR